RGRNPAVREVLDCQGWPVTRPDPASVPSTPQPRYNCRPLGTPIRHALPLGEQHSVGNSGGRVSGICRDATVASSALHPANLIPRRDIKESGGLFASPIHRTAPAVRACGGHASGQFEKARLASSSSSNCLIRNTRRSRSRSSRGPSGLAPCPPAWVLRMIGLAAFCASCSAATNL
ncbi:MAG: hypothetical protein ACI8QZ_003054, partial [Chlamydiales bacterium]